MSKLLISVLITAILVSGCNTTPNSSNTTTSGVPPADIVPAPTAVTTTTEEEVVFPETTAAAVTTATGLVESDIESELIEQVANLPVLNMASMDNYERFSSFADAINRLVRILNKNRNETFDIPELEVTQANYEKASIFITEYGPLIKNYNDVIEAARDVREGNAESEEFYKKAAVFGLEIAIICTGVFYPMTFDTVGIIYRAAGLSRIALNCPSCVSTVLSTAHETLKSALVPDSVKVVDQIIGNVQSLVANLNPAKLTDKVKDLFENPFDGD